MFFIDDNEINDFLVIEQFYNIKFLFIIVDLKYETKMVVCICRVFMERAPEY